MPFLLLYLLQSLFLLQVGIVPTVRGADEDGRFTSPAAKGGRTPVWTIGDTEVISWETELSVFNVTIWQQNMEEDGATTQGNIYSKIDDSYDISNFTWAVQVYDFDLSFSNTFFLWMNPNTAEGFTSNYFNITEPSETTTNTATSSVTGAAEPSLTDSPNLSPTESAASSSEKEADSSSGLSETGKIALGVGIGVGIPILGALLVLIWLKLRQPPSYPGSSPASDTMRLAGPILHERPKSPLQYQPKEVKGSDPTDFYPELPSHQH